MLGPDSGCGLDPFPAPNSLERDLGDATTNTHSKKIWFPGGTVAYTPGFEPRTPVVRVKRVSIIIGRPCDTVTGIRNHQCNVKRSVSLLHIVSVQNSSSSGTGRHRGLHDMWQEPQEHYDSRVTFQVNAACC